jgi:hypothetical protein
MDRCYPSAVVGVVAVALAFGRCCDHQSGGPRLLVVVVLLLFLLSVPEDGPRATRLGSSTLWGRVPCTALDGSGAFVGQSEERGDSFHVMWPTSPTFFHHVLPIGRL